MKVIISYVTSCLLAVTTLTGCFWGFQRVPSPLSSLGDSASLAGAPNVELAVLLDDLARFHGKLIQTKGYVNLEFEGNAIYPGPERLSEPMESVSDSGFFASAHRGFFAPYRRLWLNTDDLGFSTPVKYKGSATVVGKVDTARRGHRGVFLGEIDVQYLIFDAPALPH